MPLNPDYAVEIYYGLKIQTAALVSRFWPLIHRRRTYEPKSLQLRVSQWFSTPRYDTYCIIWVKKDPAWLFQNGVFPTNQLNLLLKPIYTILK